MVQRLPRYRRVVWLNPSQQSLWQMRRIYQHIFWRSRREAAMASSGCAGCPCCPACCSPALMLAACTCGGVTCRGEPRTTEGQDHCLWKYNFFLRDGVGSVSWCNIYGILASSSSHVRKGDWMIVLCAHGLSEQVLQRPFFNPVAPLCGL